MILRASWLLSAHTLFDHPSHRVTFWSPATRFSAVLTGKVLALLGRSAELRPLYASGSQYTRCLLARWRLGMLLEQLQQPLAASPGYFPRGQPPSWDRGAGLDEGGRRPCGGGAARRSHPPLRSRCGLFLALHGLALQPILALTHIMVYEYSRNDFRGQQARERTKEKGGSHSPKSRTWGIISRWREIRACNDNA